MKHFFTTLSLLIGTAVHAQSELRPLVTADQARAWGGVGRLEIQDGSRVRYCSGALIEPNLVLTAAHCVVSPQTDASYDASLIKFMAGWRDGRASGYGQANRVAVHADYTSRKGVTGETVATDLAVVQLAVPMNINGIKPFARHSQPSVGQKLMVVSYAHDRNDAPSIQEECKVIQSARRVITSTCSADFGTSGAPIFVVEDGIPKIASVVSAKGQLRNGEKISLGVSLEEPLEELLRQLKKPSGLFQRITPGTSLAEQLGRNKK